MTLVEQVKRYAVEHRDLGGWSVVADSWDDATIAEVIGWTRTLDGAIRKIDRITDVYEVA